MYISALSPKTQVLGASLARVLIVLEERQRQSDVQRGRTPDDERKPKDKDGKPKGGKPYQRDFGVPPAKAQASGRSQGGDM